MGSDVHVLVVGGDPGLVGLAHERIVALERRWSRFRPDSEVTRINAGGRVGASAVTRTLVRCGLRGWERSDGWFDPGVLDAVVAAGYDRDFRTVRSRPAMSPARGAAAERQPAPATAGWADVDIDDEAGTVRLPAGVHFDPGGIGKGLGADLVVGELLAEGAAGACINVGGDLRVAGRPPDAAGWRVELTVRPEGHRPLLHLRHGAVATSGTLQRRWVQQGRAQHHLVDPNTGAPAAIGRREVTVVAATAWEAEVAAKVAALAPRRQAAPLLRRLGAVALVADDVCGPDGDGPPGTGGRGAGPQTRMIGDFARFLTPDAASPVGAGRCP